jgi:hypothetical protein
LLCRFPFAHVHDINSPVRTRNPCAHSKAVAHSKTVCLSEYRAFVCQVYERPAFLRAKNKYRTSTIPGKFRSRFLSGWG